MMAFIFLEIISNLQACCKNTTNSHIPYTQIPQLFFVLSTLKLPSITSWLPSFLTWSYWLFLFLFLYMCVCFYPLLLLRFFSLSLSYSNLITMCLGMVSLYFCFLGPIELLGLWVYIFYQIWKIFSHDYFFTYFFLSVSLEHQLHVSHTTKLCPIAHWGFFS